MCGFGFFCQFVLCSPASFTWTCLWEPEWRELHHKIITHSHSLTANPFWLSEMVELRRLLLMLSIITTTCFLHWMPNGVTATDPNDGQCLLSLHSPFHFSLTLCLDILHFATCCTNQNKHFFTLFVFHSSAINTCATVFSDCSLSLLLCMPMILTNK